MTEAKKEAQVTNESLSREQKMQMVRDLTGEKSPQQTAEDTYRRLGISPSKRYVLLMPNDVLIQQYSFIRYKICTLSRFQRDMIEQRVSFKIQQKEFTLQEVQDEMDKLKIIILKAQQDEENN